MKVVLSLAKKLTAVLIAFVFLGATAECAALCVQPQSQTSGCHHRHDASNHADSCAKPMLTAAHVSSAEIPVPTLIAFHFEFAPVIFARHAVRVPEFLSPPPIASLRTTVLLI
jgi:hypothetical protein